MTKVGMPASSARVNAGMPSRSAPTATMSAPYDASAQASMSAPRFEPVPLTSTTSRARSGRADTFGRLFDPRLWHAPAVVARGWTMRAGTPAQTVSARFLLVAVVAVGLAALHLPYRPRTVCLLRAATGIPCPFCGGTTAVVELGQVDVRGAVAASPLAVALAGALPFVGVLQLPQVWRRPAVRYGLLAAVVVAAEIWQLVRFGLIGA